MLQLTESLSTWLDCAMALGYNGALCVHQHLQRGIKLRSRRGEGNAIWTILVIGLIAVVASAVLFPIGSKVIQMGQDAAGKLQSPPW